MTFEVTVTSRIVIQEKYDTHDKLCFKIFCRCINAEVDEIAKAVKKAKIDSKKKSAKKRKTETENQDAKKRKKN